MKQETNQQKFNQSEQKSKGEIKNFIYVGVVGSLLGALLVGGVAYVVLSNSYLENQAQPTSQVSTLQNHIETLETPDKTAQSSTTVTPVRAVDTDSIQSYTNNPSVTTCDFWKERTYENVYTDIEGNDAAGTVSITGRIVQLVEDASWVEDKKITKVYLVFSHPTSASQQVFYDHYMAIVQGGNGVNRFNGQQLLFKLGTKEGSGLATSADISNELGNRLISLIDKTDTIELKLTMPIYGGRGVGDTFSFACEVSE